MSDVVNFQEHIEEAQPQEPDWNELHRLLREAEDWLRSEEGIDCFPGEVIAAAEAAALCQMMLSPECFETNDDIIRGFVNKVDWAAFWLQGVVDDQELQKRLMSFCEDYWGTWKQLLACEDI